MNAKIIGNTNLVVAGICLGIAATAAMHGNVIGVAVNITLAALNFLFAYLNLRRS